MFHFLSIRKSNSDSVGGVWENLSRAHEYYHVVFCALLPPHIYHNILTWDPIQNKWVPNQCVVIKEFETSRDGVSDTLDILVPMGLSWVEKTVGPSKKLFGRLRAPPRGVPISLSTTQYWRVHY